MFSKTLAMKHWRAIQLASSFIEVYTKAIADCTGAIRVAPHDPLAYNHRAAFYRALGNEALAAKDEREAAELSY